MKKLFFFLLGISLFAGVAQAQTPERKAISLFHKVTATWCYPCGTWGWELSEDIRNQVGDKALYMSLYNNDDAAWDNDDFYNLTAKALAEAFVDGPGWPSFGVNGEDFSEVNTNDSFQIDVAGVKSDCIAAINAFATTLPVASAASTMSISGNTVNVTAKTQFWEATSGEYYIAAYLIEDGAMHIQNNADLNSLPVAHHGLLRASMTTSSVWGEQIANGPVPANQSDTRTFSFTVPDTSWDKAKLKVYNILWKKENGKYQFVNANVAQSVATGIETLLPLAGVRLFPNPVTGNLNVQMEALQSADAAFTVVDFSGRRVHNVKQILQEGIHTYGFNTASFAPGIYILSIETEFGTIQKKFIKE